MLKDEVKLLICDIDGTPVEKGDSPLPLTHEALYRFHEAGVMIVLRGVFVFLVLTARDTKQLLPFAAAYSS